MNTVYKNYYQSFLDVAKKYLKPNVGIKFEFYPFDGGALIYVELLSGAGDRAIQRKTEGTLSAALHRTTLFESKICESFNGKSISETLYHICSPDRYLLFKSDEEKDWSAHAAYSDFKVIMKKLLEKYGA